MGHPPSSSSSFAPWTTWQSPKLNISSGLRAAASGQCAACSRPLAGWTSPPWTQLPLPRVSPPHLRHCLLLLRPPGANHHLFTLYPICAQKSSVSLAHPPWSPPKPFLIVLLPLHPPVPLAPSSFLSLEFSRPEAANPNCWVFVWQHPVPGGGSLGPS